MAKRIQIFRVGTHTAMDGKSYDFTEQMLRAAVAAYDPTLHEAPLVVGHPKTDDPAYGAAKSLHFADGILEAEPHEVDPAFAELVNSKRYKKISTSWYLPDSPGNPKPGELYIKHIGFLGAQAPAIKGLKPAHFSGSNEGVVEFSDIFDMQNASLWRRMRDWLIGEKGLEEADRVLPDYQIQSLEQSARDPAPNSISYAEHSEQDAMTPEQIKAAQDKLAADQAALQAAQQKLQADQASFAERENAQAKNARHSQNVAFIDGLVTEGKLLPAHKDGMVAFMDGLAADGVVEFGEGDKVTKTPSIDFLKDYLSKQQKLVEFGEHKGAGDDAAAISADDSKQIAAAAVEFQEAEAKAGREISTVEAVTHIMNTQVSQ